MPNSSRATPRRDRKNEQEATARECLPDGCAARRRVAAMAALAEAAPEIGKAIRRKQLNCFYS